MLSFKKYYKKISTALTIRRSSKQSDRHEKVNKRALPNLIKKTIRQPEKARPQSKLAGIPENSQQVQNTQLANKELKLPKASQSEGTSQLDKASQLESARKEAQSQIQLSPAVAKWYINLAEIYRQENNLLAALKVYKQGAASVPPDDAQHSHLQKEMQAVSATLTRLNLQLSLIPYEIWQLIVQFLDLKDLRQCAGASALWSNMLLELPWEAFFLSRVRTDKANDPFELTIHCGTGCSREITLKEIFMILSHWKSNTFQTLSTLHNCNSFMDGTLTDVH
ncbi:hypothetical protein BJV82DRAFT_576286 [Fennellomyces sp. T-0311]|nr:hypothetical protein BJV82DRAFT_576286 [Fennellomyces sp. T-0311]